MRQLTSIFNNCKAFFYKRSVKMKVAIILLVFILSFLIIRSIFFKSKTDYSTIKVEKSDITEIVDESGVIKISGQTDIFSPTNGIIEELYVANGDQVITGQELFKVKSTATDQEKQASYANYLAAKVLLDSAESDALSLQATMFGKWDIFRELATNNDYQDSDGKPKYENRALPEFHIPEKEWLAAEAKYIDQQQVITQAKAALSSAWQLYQSTQTSVVKSTNDGVVANLGVIQGDSVKATDTEPVLIVADYTVFGVLISLSESDIDKVEPGDEATVEVDPINNKSYEGVVRRVNEIGKDEGKIVKYDVFIEITNRDDRLKSGMSADVVIVTKKVIGVTSVPNTSVKPYKGGKAVQIVNSKNELEFVPVQVGVKGEKKTEILKGLAVGQEIVSALTNDQIKRKGILGF